MDVAIIDIPSIRDAIHTLSVMDKFNTEIISAMAIPPWYLGVPPDPNKVPFGENLNNYGGDKGGTT
jgi:hypothetical protein